ncbi:hypothetical protein M9H77_21209 [Catharanthus roseus]|uniref:Uncharacterized protein n=1 Tax=Catharanthus roseus TaxID=4058 RepID=A0ACC0AMD7_CATRO|nr:hypothetical protein M9H77_21209 [Catharanthus roseus]
MASSSSLSAIKVVLQSINGKTFEVDEAIAKLTRIGPVIIPNVSGNILTKIVEYCKRVYDPNYAWDRSLKASHHIYCNKYNAVFDGTTLHSLYLDKYVYLKTRERKLAILQRELEAHETALNAQGSGWAAQTKYFVL